MEMDLDLQNYIDVVLSHWKVVLIVFLTATIAATVVSVIQEPTYEATVTLVEQSYEFWDMPRLSSLDRTVVKLYPTLARTQAVENEVVQALEASLSPAERAPGALLSMVTVREDRENPALFRIRVHANDPGKATLIANTWAEQYQEALTSLEVGWTSQLEAVEQNLESAETALTEFKQQTGLGLFGLVEEPELFQPFMTLGPHGTQLRRKFDLLAEHRQARDNLLLLIQSAQLARDAGEGIEALPLQLLSTSAISDRGELSIQSVKDQGDLEVVIQAFQTEEAIISGVIDQLSLEVGQLQYELAQDQLELERLTRARDLAEGAYTALTNEIRENQLFQTEIHILSRASRAALVGPNRRLNVTVGAALGLAGGVLAAFALEYLQASRKTS